MSQWQKMEAALGFEEEFEVLPEALEPQPDRPFGSDARTTSERAALRRATNRAETSHQIHAHIRRLRLVPPPEQVPGLPGQGT